MPQDCDQGYEIPSKFNKYKAYKAFNQS